MVKQPSSGVASTTSLRARIPRSRRYQSARKANSIGATGHLIGMSAMFTTSRPPSKRSSVRCERRGPRQVVEGEDALVPAGTGHAFGLLRLQAHAARDDEHVVRQHSPVVEQHLVALDPDLFDLVLVEDDAVCAAGVGAAARSRLRVRARRGRTAGRAGRRAGRRGRRRGSRPRPASKRRRSRLAVIVPPVPPPRITICFLVMTAASRAASRRGHRRERGTGLRATTRLSSCPQPGSAPLRMWRYAGRDEDPGRRRSLETGEGIP